MHTHIKNKLEENTNNKLKEKFDRVKEKVENKFKKYDRKEVK